MALTEKQKSNLEYAHQWLARARQDFNTFKKLVPFDKKTQRTVRCSDPALAVYLLQQSIEKAVKAVAAASGQYSPSKLRRFTHNSLVLLLDFYANTLAPRLLNMGFGPFLDALGLNTAADLEKMAELKRKVRSDEFAFLPPEPIDRLAKLLLEIREAFLQSLRYIFSPGTKIQIDTKSLKMDSPEAFVDSLLAQMRAKSNMPGLTDEQKQALIAWYRAKSSIQPAVAQSQSAQETIEVTRPTEEWLGQWAMIALYLLAAITFPHHATSRYPLPKSRERGLGCGDYNEQLGIVNRLGQLGRVTELALHDIRPQLEIVATFFSVAETIKHRDRQKPNETKK